MSEPKFTRGPLEVHFDPVLGCYTFCTREGEEVGQCYENDSPRAKYNAHLFKAAPDLYAACAKLIEADDLPETSDYLHANIVAQAIELARKSVAAAGGEATP
jgi:hypothetical protein